MTAISPISVKNNEQDYVNLPQNLESSVSVFDEIENIFDSDEDLPYLTVDDFNVDEKIDDSQQGQIGDCWLLSGLNALSYSKKGRELIKEAITVKSDCFEVAFDGVNVTETITPKEMEEARKSNKYSCGDDDVLLMELAFEKVMEEVKLGKISAPEYLSKVAKNDGETSIDGGRFSYLLYLLKGEESLYQYNCYSPLYDDGGLDTFFQRTFPWWAELAGNSMENVYDKIEKNPENITAVLYFYAQKGNVGDVIIQDIEGNDVVLSEDDEGHAWSIKSVDGDNVTMVNPWDSDKEIVVSKSEIKKYAEGISYYEWQ